MKMNYLFWLFLATVGPVLSVPTVAAAVNVDVDAVVVSTDAEVPPPMTSMLPRTLKWSKKATPSSASPPPPPPSPSPPPLDPQLLYVAQNQHCSLYRSGSEEAGTYWFVTEYQEKKQAAATAGEDIIVFADRPFRTVSTMSIEKFVEEFPQNFQTSNPNVAVSFFPNDVCSNAEEDDQEEIVNPVLVAIFSDPEIITLNYKDGTTKMFVGYTVNQSPSQAEEASLASYFGDETEEDENGIVSTRLGPCSMMIDSVPACDAGTFPYLCETKYHCIPATDKFLFNSTNCANIFAFLKEAENYVPPSPAPTPFVCPTTCCTFGCVACVVTGNSNC